MGQTLHGLPWPADTDPVMAGAQAIHALADAADALIGSAPMATPQDLYAGMAALAGPGLAFPGFPIATNLAPETARDDYTYAAADMRVSAFMVRKAAPTLGMGFLLTGVASGGTMTQYTGGTLLQMMADGTWKLLANTGATQAAVFLNASGAGVGWRALKWRDAADTADTPVNLTGGVVYQVALTIGTYATAQPKVAAFNSTAGSAEQLNVNAPGGWIRSGSVTPQNGKRTTDVLKVDQKLARVAPLLVVY